MIRVDVDLGERGYPILIGSGVLGNSASIVPYVAGDQVAVITNETVAPLWLPTLMESLGRRRVDVLQLPDGEAYKTLEQFGGVMDFLISKGHHRSTTVVALGGGVVGDVAGFAAATFQRGVALVQIPTTLLAQVDSSVGGKTAVNHPLGKNMIGAFYQPRAVIADTAVLATLPEREYRSGLAEVLKYGVIADSAFFAWLENNARPLLERDAPSVAYAVQRSCEIKADVVRRDERESGVRAILNFGHTFGHALEAVLGYGELLHGEAVAVGMVAAAELSDRLFGHQADRTPLAPAVRRGLDALGLGTAFPACRCGRAGRRNGHGQESS